MLFERIESEGLAHYSYLVGDEGQALVIDPRRDCGLYVAKATRKGMRITTILETHRNEDYVVGSVELAARTGAEIWHADAQLDYQYGRPVADGQGWQVGRLALRAIHSPGHTPGSMSYLLHDPDGAPWVLFSGDALFAGEVGRVDFLGMDRAPEMASHLYDTIFHKFLPLGDQVIVCPAHGSGSVCGSGIAERVWTTIGLERRLNPRLQFTNRDDFITHVVRELEYSPGFERPEAWNLRGAPLLGALPTPPPLSPREFAEKAREAIVLDTRPISDFGAAHAPGALSIWRDEAPLYAGWFLSFDRPILLVNETNDPTQIVRYLIRLGFDNLAGCLAGGMLDWHKAGLASNSIGLLPVHDLRQRLARGERPWILDVRSQEEVDGSPLPGAHHIHFTQVPKRQDEIPRDRPLWVACATGLRSMTAASYLRREGWENLTVVLGGPAD